jgi:hypothetical protein
MHDLRYLRGHRAEVEKGLATKHAKVDLDSFYKLDEERLQRLAEVPVDGPLIGHSRNSLVLGTQSAVCRVPASNRTRHPKICGTEKREK